MEPRGWSFALGSDAVRWLAAIGCAVLVTAVSFALIFAAFAWPYPLFALWLHLSRTEKIAATAVYFFSLFCVVIWTSIAAKRRTRQLRAPR
jgi:hypothetical protein